MGLAVSILLIIVGVLIVGYWVLFAVGGHLRQGIRTLESGGFIIFHIAAEIVTAALCIAGGMSLIGNRGELVALLGVGMLLYTSINGLAWKEVRTRPVLSLMFIAPAIVSVLAAVYLMLA